VIYGEQPPPNIVLKFSGTTSDIHRFPFGDDGQITIKLVAPSQTNSTIQSQRLDQRLLEGNLFEILPGDSFRITNMKEGTPLNLTLKIKPQINKDAQSVPTVTELNTAIRVTIEEDNN